MRGASLLWIAGLAACGAAEPRPRPIEVEGAELAMSVPAEGPIRVEFAAVGGDGRREPVARLESVRIRTAEDATPVLLPIEQVLPALGGLRLRAEEHRGHRVTLALQSQGTEVDVELGDEVALGAPLVQLELVYGMVAPADEWHAPAVASDPDQCGVDWASPAMVGWLRAGPRILALCADPEQPNRTRRIPTSLQAELAPEPRLVHGWRAAGRETSEPLLDRAGRDVSGSSLLLRHRLRMPGRGGTPQTFAALLDERMAQVDAGARPLGPIGLAARLQAARSARTWIWREVSYAGRSFSSLAHGDQLASFQLGRATPLLAFAWSDPATGFADRARSMTELMLALPARGGLFPARMIATAGGSATWQEPDAPLRAADSAWAAFWMLRCGERFPHLGPALRSTCQRTAGFLAANQRADGSIPASYEPEFLRPTSDRLGSAELAACVLFLFEHARVAADATSAAAARKAWQLLQELAAQEERAPLATQALTALAANAALRAGLDADAVQRRMLGALASRQALWCPGWIDAELRGCLVSNSHPAVWSPPVQALAALAWLEAYSLGTRSPDLARGAAALRAAAAALPWSGWSALPPASTFPAGEVEAHLALVEAVALVARTEFGDGVLDAAAGIGIGFEAVWFENILREPGRIAFDLLTESPDPQPVRIQFRGLAEDRSWIVVANGVELGLHRPSELAAGVPIVPRRVAQAQFAPAREIPARASWRPRALVDAEDPAALDLTVVIERDGRLLAELPLVPAEAERLWIVPAATPLPDELVRTGDLLQVRLAMTERGRTTWLPADGSRTVLVGPTTCIDPGYDDEWELTDPGESRRLRIEDRASGGRWLPHDGAIGYQIPVPAQATHLELEFELRGAAQITSGSLVLHADRTGAGSALRRVPITLTDRRLWAAGMLPLQLRATSQGGLQLARIRYGATGEVGPALEASPTERGTEAPVGLAVRVIPLSLADAPLRASRVDLANAVGAGQAYVLTPEPDSRRTAGALTALFQRQAGGATSLVVELEDPVELSLLAAELPADPQARAAALRDALETRIRLAPDEVALVIHAERLQADRHMLLCGRHAFVSERNEDGSFVATGRMLHAILSARFGLVERAGADQGRFGLLALNADGDGHAPASLLGVDLAAVGWADLVRLDPARARSGLKLDLAPQPSARAVHVLPCSQLPGRGDLVLEARAGDEADPVRAGSGLLAYWRLPVPLSVHRIGSPPVAVHWLRLSASLGVLDVPFVAGGDGDLLTRATLLDGESTPSLTTPQGDAAWEIRDLQQRRDGSFEATVRSHAIDLFEHLAGASLGEGPGARPVPIGAETGPVRRQPTGVQLTAGAAPVRVHFAAPQAASAARLFARVRPIGGAGVLRITAAGAERARIDGQPGDPLAVILDWSEPGAMAFELGAGEGQATWRIEQALLVPRARGSLPLAAFPHAAGARLQDGAFYGPVLRVAVTARTQPPLILPVALPGGRALLRLECARGWRDAAGELLCTLALRTDAGRTRQQIVQLRIPPRAASSEPVATHLFELRPPLAARTGFLELQLDGQDGAELFVPTLSLEAAR